MYGDIIDLACSSGPTVKAGFTSLVHERLIPSFGRAAGAGYEWLRCLNNQTKVESVNRYFGKA